MREQFCLRQEDLRALEAVSMLKPDPRANGASIRIYPSTMAMSRALEVWGSREAVELERKRRRETKSRRRARVGAGGGRSFMILRPTERSAAVGHRAVTTALLANATITMAKLAAFLATGSGTVLAETLHSLGDTTNQGLVAFGVWRSSRLADADHPYGYVAEQYVWSLVSAVGLMFVGCGVSVSHGVLALMQPEPLGDTASLWGAIGVIGLAGALEAVSFRVALEEVTREANKTGSTLFDYIKHGSDPVNVGVLLEDGVAVLGAGVATGCLALCVLTGSPVYDALGSIAIGISLGGVSLALISKNRRLLLGRSMSLSRVAALRRLLEDEPSVRQVHDIKTVTVGPGISRFKAEVHFDSTQLALAYLDEGSNQEQLVESYKRAAEADDYSFEVQRLFLATCSLQGMLIAGEIDRLEAIMIHRFPEIKYVDIEPF
jgi:zinc transporter 9